MMRFVLSLILAFWGGSALCNSAFPNGLSAKDVQTVVASAVAEVGFHSEIVLSSARRFPACDHVPMVSPLGTSWETVQLVCHAPRIWKRSFRTGINDATPRAPATPVILGDPIVVLNKSLSRGAVITEQDVTFHATDREVVVNGFTNISDVIGRRMSQHLGKGRAVLARHLEQNWMIEKDQPVQIVFDLYGIEVIAPGRALDMGQIGDLIRVENTSTSLNVRGVVTSKNKIVVRSKIN